MKRYRPTEEDFDTRATILRLEIDEDWDPEIKELHRQNKDNVENGLIQEFGDMHHEVKIKNFSDLGPYPFSMVYFHNKFLHQVRHAFIVSSYYPALTGACALGERILNHLILNLRDSYRHTKEYKNVYDKGSFDNWETAISTLESWGVLLPEAVNLFRELATIRNSTIHFRPETDENDREIALKAISVLSNIIWAQFSAFGLQPWFIPGTRGVVFIKKAAEKLPFVAHVYLPRSALVGPFHMVNIIPTEAGLEFLIEDQEYPDTEISDEEFVRLYNEKHG